MKNLNLALVILGAFACTAVTAQGNPFLKKYAGSYYHLAFGTEQPTSTSEVLLLTADSKCVSTYFPVDANGVAAKTASKKSGTWKASEGQIEISFPEKGTVAKTAFKMDDGLFMSENSFLKKILVSSLLYLKKYAGSYYLLQDGEEQPGDGTYTLLFTPDGKCVRTGKTYDENGNLQATLSKATGTWKANDGVLEMRLTIEGVDEIAEFSLTDGIFRDKSYNFLKKVVPPDYYLKLYAGNYVMLTDDAPVATNLSDRYTLTADGKCTWTIAQTVNADGSVSKVPVKKAGTWKAGEGLIQLYFEGGEELLTDFKLDNGVFRNGNVFLKKPVAATPAKPTKK